MHSHVPFELFSLVGSISTMGAAGEGTGDMVFSLDGIMISDKLSDELEVSNSGSSFTGSVGAYTYTDNIVDDYW